MPRSRSRSPLSRRPSPPRREREREETYRGEGPSSKRYDSSRKRDYVDDHRPTRSDRGGRDRSERERERESNDSRRRRRDSRSRSPRRSGRADEGQIQRSEEHWGVGSRPRSGSASPPPKPKQQPNFKNSGLLAAATNTVKNADGTSTVLKYNEPPEARKPTDSWRLYVFKGKEQVDLLHIYRQSAYLAGRDRAVTDLHIEHPSCSKQHAAIQFRQVTERNEFGDSKTTIKPFIIDLESTNGTHVNDVEIPTSRYYELHAGDVIKFGQSLREYVLLNESGV